MSVRKAFLGSGASSCSDHMRERRFLAAIDPDLGAPESLQTLYAVTTVRVEYGDTISIAIHLPWMSLCVAFSLPAICGWSHAQWPPF